MGELGEGIERKEKSRQEGEGKREGVVGGRIGRQKRERDKARGG